MWVLTYKVDYGGHKAGDLHLIGHGAFNPSNHNMGILNYVEIPDQDVSHLYDEEGNLHGTLADLKQYTAEEQAALIDRDTGEAIDRAIHPFAGIEEQIGIIRADLATLHVKVGVDPTDEFAKLNAIAAEKIQEGQKKKESIDAKDS